MDFDDSDELERLQDLESLAWAAMRDSPAFANVLTIAQSATKVETVLINLIDAQTQETVASINWAGPHSVDRNFSLCLSTIRSPEIREIPDLTQHAEFAQHPSVVEAPHLRYYAAAPITTPRGHRVGTLCLLDSCPRRLSEEQTFYLRELADVIADLLELNRSNHLLAKADIARQQQASAAMINLYQRALEASGSAIMIFDATDPQLSVVYVNPAFEAMTGYSFSEVLGRDSRFLQGGDITQAGRKEFRAAITERREGRAVMRMFRKDGSEFWVDVRISPVLNGQGKVSHYVGFQLDVTDRVHHERELAHMATHDSLTGLPNRTLMRDRLDQAIARHKLSGTPFAVALVDLDRFKLVNDSLGHADGDILLCTVGKRLSDLVGNLGTVARMGGDEFVLLLTDYPTNVALAQFIDEILETLREPHAIAGSQLVLEASIGVSTCPEHGCESGELLRNADTAMYFAKSKGRGNSQYYQSIMTVEASKKLNLQSELQRAIARREFVLHYQPQFYRNGDLCGLEALVRWNHPTRGLLFPGAFIDAAEEFGLIELIGTWVLGEACRQNKAWQDEGLLRIPVGVNVSVSQMRRTSFLEEVERALGESGLPARYLDLEITETMVMDGPERIVELLYRLRQLGTKTSIDDFGTGYSSLSFIRRFALDALKIDRSFVNDITTDSSAAAICDTIIRMGHNLGLRVVAEGVETEQQASFLRENQCDVLQGFLFSRAKPAADLVALLRPSPRG